MPFLIGFFLVIYFGGAIVTYFLTKWLLSYDNQSDFSLDVVAIVLGLLWPFAWGIAGYFDVKERLSEKRVKKNKRKRRLGDY